MVWFGADPGGKGSFGVALLRDDGSFSSKCVTGVREALEYMTERPQGIGVDCPLWWSSAPTADRRADKWLRSHKIPSGTVQAANSLRGSVLVQGMMLAVGARERYPRVRITEAHPKALLQFLGLKNRPWRQVSKRFQLHGEEPPEHERDALLAAVAAREGFTGKWQVDLSTQRDDCELDPTRMWFGPVQYYWPACHPAKT